MSDKIKWTAETIGAVRIHTGRIDGVTVGRVTRVTWKKLSPWRVEDMTGARIGSAMSACEGKAMVLACCSGDDLADEAERRAEGYR